MESKCKISSIVFKSFNLCCFCTVAAEQKARVVYDNILKVSDDPDVNDVIKFLREREVVHFQRFGEALDQIQNRRPKKCYCGGFEK